MVMLTPETEWDFRRRWYEAHRRRLGQDPEAVGRQKGIQEGLIDAAPAGLAIRDSLRNTGDLEEFIKSLRNWSLHQAKPFNNFGQMFMNQVVQYSTDGRGPINDPKGTTELLSDVLRTPTDDADASSKIDRLVDHAENIKRKGQPAPGRVPFVLSFMWSLADRSGWPVFWKSAADFFEFVTSQALPESLSGRYQAFRSMVMRIDDDCERFERVAAWWAEFRPLVLDSVLLDRSAFGWHFDESHAEEVRQNAQALVGIADYWGKVLKPELEELLALKLVSSKPPLEYVAGRPRSDLFVHFSPGRIEPGIRVGLDQEGLAIGVGSGLGPKGWRDYVVRLAEHWKVEGCEVISTRRATLETQHESGWRPDQVMYGRYWVKDRLPADARPVIIEAAQDLRDCLAELAEEYPLFAGPANGPTPGVGTGAKQEGGLEERLDNLANELLVDRDFLTEIVGLLEDKDRHQVIFYGPPGTGKTYLAKKLAAALAPDSDRRSLVQFHPSMSYEDFFEGYRPKVANGRMTYELTPGPLRRLAEKAASATEQRHVMVIDEINRANLPTVLGELLFLLEYREEDILPQYQPDKAFQLPPNLWFIGTMNTADRSIALVDAALRRRFHFVPFFPNYGPMKGLLEDWLKAEREEAWVGEMVAKVNEELVKALGGDHLQLGATHFMKSGISDLDNGKLKRVWQYTIVPFIEEQLFDKPGQIARFQLQQVLKRHGPGEHHDGGDSTSL